MATIKGITIEIGGNTTGLQEALKDVNKNINGLGSELRQVDRLLKLDPTNTTLLAQKQDLLKKSIEGVSDKLKTLKNSQEQVEQSFKNGNIGEEQYRAFQREVVQAENKLNRLNNELNETNNKTSKLDTAKMKEMGTVAVATTGAVVGAVALAIAGVGRVATETITKIDDAIKKAGEYADEVMTLAKVTNLDNATVQSWGYAAEFIDTETDTIVRSLAKMTKGLESNKEKFEELGVTIENQDGTYRSQREIFLDTIEALGQYGDETERDKLAMELFGKSAQELNPLIKAGKDELSKLSQEAENLGLILSDEDLLQLGKFDDMMKKIEALSKSFSNKIALIFEPLASSIYEPFAEGFGEVNKIMADGIQEGDTDKIKEQITLMITNMREGIDENLPILADGFVQILDLISEVISDPKNAKEVEKIVTSTANAINAVLDKGSPALKLAGGKILSTIIQGMRETEIDWGALVKEFIYDRLVTFNPIAWLIKGAFGGYQDSQEWKKEIEDTGKLMIGDFFTGLIGDGREIHAKGSEIGDKIKEGLKAKGTELFNQGVNSINEIGDGIKNNLWLLSLRGFEIMNNIKVGIQNGLSGLYAMGFNVVSGIWEGISGGYGWIIARISGWVDDVVEYIKRAFRINSPSALMRDEVGMMIGLGVAGGIMESLPAVKGAMGYLQNQVMTSSNPLINPRLATAGVSNTLAPVITININGNADKSVVDYAVDKINKQLGGLI